jgi:hypothetical protein
MRTATPRPRASSRFTCSPDPRQVTLTGRRPSGAGRPVAAPGVAMMNITRPLPTTVLSLAGQQAPALFVFSLLVNLPLLVSDGYMLQVYDCVLSTGPPDKLLWLTVATLVAIIIYGGLEQARRLMAAGCIASWVGRWSAGQCRRVSPAGPLPGPNWRPREHRHHHFSRQVSSKRSRLSISPR